MKELNNNNFTDAINMWLHAKPLCINLYGHISKWNTKYITNMDYIFSNSTFNDDISNWNVSNVTSMKNMFSCNYNFNYDISKWNVSNVENM